MDTDGKAAAGAGEIIDFVAGITGTARLRIEENLPHGFVRLKVAEAERRQAQHDIRSVEDIVTELARNSRDAGARHVMVSFHKEKGRYRRLAVIDDGRGVPPDMHQIIFEPRVTSKRDDFTEDRYGVHGRGMALFSIRSRVPDARVVSSKQGTGCVIALNADTEAVPERADQATLPRLERGEDGTVAIGVGPRNVARTLVELSCDDSGTAYFLGSPAEVLATMRALGSTPEGAAYWAAVSQADEAPALAALASSTYGLPVSERNAYRVLRGEIVPLPPIGELALVNGKPAARETVAARPAAQTAKPFKKLAKQDLDEIAESTREAAERVLSRYYLTTAGPPKVRRGRGKITVSMYVTDEEEGER